MIFLIGTNKHREVTRRLFILTTFFNLTLWEGKFSKAKRFWVAFKFALVPQNVLIFGFFKFSLNFPFLVFVHLVSRFLMKFFTFEHFRAVGYDDAQEKTDKFSANKCRFSAARIPNYR